MKTSGQVQPDLPHETLFRHDLGAFLRASFDGWVKYTTGGAAVAIGGTYVALSGPSAEAARFIAWFVFAFAILAGVFHAWREEHRQRRALETFPALRVVFRPGEIPYQQDRPGVDLHTLDTTETFFRLGVTHDGRDHVEGVRMKLVAIEPLPDPAFPILYELARMGGAQPILAPGPEPTLFFDLLIDLRTRHGDGLHGSGSRPFVSRLVAGP